MNWKRFGYEGEPGTCLWCGTRLHYKTVYDSQSDARRQDGLAQGLSYLEADKASQVKAKKAGAYQDDFFCTATCGYWFGRRMAELDRRLQ